MIYHHFPRPDLARRYAGAIQGKTLFGDAHNGLFLAGPRRTGKSTFLQADLAPELERQGLLVVYVDLWANAARDPGELIADAIGRAIDAQRGLLHKAARASGLESVSIAGIKLDTHKIGRNDGATLVDALKALHKAAGKSIAFIIDEAQHALTTEAGENAMKALKSARDQINVGNRIELMLVMSGSDRDKLLRLVNNNAAAFYGSSVQALPGLGADFIDHVTTLVEAHLPELKPVDTAKLADAFQAFGERPQFFMEGLGQALNPLLGDQTGRFEDKLLAAAITRQAADEAQMEAEYLSLTPTARAVFWRILEKGDRFRPYDADALAFYQEVTKRKVSAQAAKNALDTLRQRVPSLVWKSARGEYAVDDIATHRWYQQKVEAGKWPPQGMATA
ncbi:hypothetical protein AGMMS50225_26170 [Betaproteobacteria bacterium]|nr:hypothetical protein AGMMS50225_26170 [Betaproteobacteria bacterium]